MKYFKKGKQVIIQVVFLAPTLVSLYTTALLLIYSYFLFMQRLWKYYSFQFLSLTALFVKLYCFQTSGYVMHVLTCLASSWDILWISLLLKLYK